MFCWGNNEHGEMGNLAVPSLLLEGEIGAKHQHAHLKPCLCNVSADNPTDGMIYVT
jgi:hypothetical protein